MQQGFEGASVRQIATLANANLAAINYHFGTKETLIEQVLKRRLDELNQKRLEALDELERAAGSKPIKPTKILGAFFGTLLSVAKSQPAGGHTFLKLLGRTLAEPADFIRVFLSHEHQHVLDRYQAALFKALPDVPKSEVIWRFHFMLGATSYAIAGTDSLRLIARWEGDDDQEIDVDVLTARLMAFLVGGLRAPLPDLSAFNARKSRQSKIAKTRATSLTPNSKAA